MAFWCECGFTFLSSTDNLSYMAHVLPDQSFDEFSGRVDDAIESSGPSPEDKCRACMGWRAFHLPKAWQCRNCGTLYVEAADGQRHRFAPADAAVSRRVFARGPVGPSAEPGAAADGRW
ncbi:MAG: hypothetical protein ACRC7O_01270 [Fimbriiglobus sp.]